ncbi:MAG: GPI inositol-deacylase [Pseudomonadota bacterium]|nr:GPI inositol-deacylase [Pseudomonadota bacterium]MDQ3160892.1 GPI inositol-deacylase [Pseudomonadota bacterium]
MKHAPPMEALPDQALPASRIGDDLRGLAQLLVRGVISTTDLAESVHATILGLPSQLTGKPRSTRTRGVPRIAYQGVRRTAELVGSSVEELLARLPPRWGQTTASHRREAMLAVLNGVMGDHLAATANPLALTTAMRINGRALPLDQKTWPSSTLASPSSRLLVQVHGLCMNDLQWRHCGHDHGEQITVELGYTAVHLHYNSGMSIASNGRAFSAMLQQLIDGWPVPIERFAIVGHSMGGLVSRAAILDATRQSHPWVRQLDQIVFLGTPHHGSPLERAGNALQTALGLTPLTAPFVRLGQLRSAGIQDLRHGTIDDKTHQGTPTALQLPAGIRAYAVAASTQAATAARAGRLLRGDGLVPVASALGEHNDPRLALKIPSNRKRLVERTGHLELLSSPEVYQHLRRWLA